MQCAVDYFHTLLYTLQHIHKLYIVHRDIKPSNIMLNGTSLVLIDFGLATFYIDADEKHVPSTYPLKQHIVGSSKYASVNVHRGYDPVRRDDVISLVYVFIAMLNGTRCPVPEYIPLRDSTRIETANFTQPTSSDSGQTDLEKTHVLHPINRYYCNKKSEILQFPECVCALVSHVYGMSFFEMPDYNAISSLAHDILLRDSTQIATENCGLLRRVESLRFATP